MEKEKKIEQTDERELAKYLSDKQISLKDAIRIAKILYRAPEERLPMILSVFEKADFYISGMDELEEWKSFRGTATLVNGEEFMRELIAAYPLDKNDKFTRIPAKEFSDFCKARKMRPNIVRRFLAQEKIITTHMEGDKVTYSETARIDGKVIRCTVIDNEAAVNYARINEDKENVNEN